MWKNTESIAVFPAATAGLGKYRAGGYGRIGVYRVIVFLTFTDNWLFFILRGREVVEAPGQRGIHCLAGQVNSFAGLKKKTMKLCTFRHGQSLHRMYSLNVLEGRIKI